MFAQFTILPRSRWCLCGRIVWACTALVHVAPLFAAIGKLWDAPDAGLALRTAALAGSLAFFASKIVGVRYLPATERPAVGVLVFLVACGLVHNELSATIVNEAEPYVVAVVATASGAALARAACRLVRWFPGRIGPAALRPLVLSRIATLREAGPCLPILQLALAPLAPRGPPR